MLILEKIFYKKVKMNSVPLNPRSGMVVPVLGVGSHILNNGKFLKRYTFLKSEWFLIMLNHVGIFNFTQENKQITCHMQINNHRILVGIKYSP
jgi:hypothetical protein